MSLSDAGKSVDHRGASVSHSGKSLSERGKFLSGSRASLSDLGSSLNDLGTSLFDLGTSLFDLGTARTAPLSSLRLTKTAYSPVFIGLRCTFASFGVFGKSDVWELGESREIPLSLSSTLGAAIEFANAPLKTNPTKSAVFQQARFLITINTAATREM